MFCQLNWQELISGKSGAGVMLYNTHTRTCTCSNINMEESWKNIVALTDSHHVSFSCIFFFFYHNGIPIFSLNPLFCVSCLFTSLNAYCLFCASSFLHIQHAFPLASLFQWCIYANTRLKCFISDLLRHCLWLVVLSKQNLIKAQAISLPFNQVRLYTKCVCVSVWWGCYGPMSCGIAHDDSAVLRPC